MSDASDLPVEYLVKDPNSAIKPLAKSLVDGSVALVIGAGASKSLGLPEWWELVKRCLKAVGEDSAVDKTTPNEQLRKKMNQVERKLKKFSEYSRVVKKCLYRGVEYTHDVIRQELLIAFGALLMGSKRGSVRLVINFNYDDVLEWYLYLHGFNVQVVTDLPTLHKDADVIIYHPHGFLPKKALYEASDFVVLSQKSYDERMGDQFEPWRELFRSVLVSKDMLFVGLSGDDPTFGPLLSNVKKSLEKDRHTGYWLFGRKKEQSELDDLIDLNVVPLCWDSYTKIPEFLMSVCQRATAQLSR